MRVMMIKADADPGATPSEELLATMDRYNDELKKAGVLVDLAGLLPSAVGRRVSRVKRSRRSRWGMRISTAASYLLGRTAIDAATPMRPGPS